MIRRRVFSETREARGDIISHLIVYNTMKSMKVSKTRGKKTRRSRRTKKTVGGGKLEDELNKAKKDLEESNKNATNTKRELERVSNELRDWYIQQNRLYQHDDNDDDNNQPSEYEPGVLENHIEDFIHTHANYKTAKTELEHAEKEKTKRQKKYDTMYNSYNSAILRRKKIPADVAKIIGDY